MKSIRFREEARDDLLSIRAWFTQFSDETASRVLDDIHTAIGLLAHFPLAGRQIEERPFRRIVTRHYRFMVAYLVEDEWITILGIHRYQNRES